MSCLFMAGCKPDGFWTRKRQVPPQLESSPQATNVQDAPRATGKYGDFQQIFADVAEGALPSVVSIHSEKQVAAEPESNDDESPFEYFFGSPGGPPHREEGLGSGVIISPDGTILTNNHVIEDADRIRIQLHDEREFEAEILGTDKASDVAVIRIKNARESFVAMPLGVLAVLAPAALTVVAAALRLLLLSRESMMFSLRLLRCQWFCSSACERC